MPFKKGETGNRNGRPKGAQNKTTGEIREAAKAIVEDPAYVRSLKKRVKAGKAPHMETLLHYYAYGKPKEQVEVSGPDGHPIRQIIHQYAVPAADVDPAGQ